MAMFNNQSVTIKQNKHCSVHIVRWGIKPQEKESTTAISV